MIFNKIFIFHYSLIYLIQKSIMENKDQEANEIILCIGYLSVYMNTFEMLIAQLNNTLLNFSYNQFEELLITKKSIAEKMELTKQLLNIIPFDNEIKHEAQNHLKLVHELRKKRNDYIHGIIHTVEEEGVSLPGLYIKSIKEWNKIGNEKIDITIIDGIKLDMLKAVITQEQINIKLIASYQIIQNDKKIKDEFIREMLKS